MRHRLLAAAGLLAAAPSLPAAEPALEQIKKDLFYLAGEECQGRGLETEGIPKAGEYVAAAFREAVEDLVGLREPEGLRDRTDPVLALLPELRRVAASISASGMEPDATARYSSR